MKVKVFNTNSLVYKIKFLWFKLKYGCRKCEHKKYVEVCFVFNNECLKEWL